MTITEIATPTINKTDFTDLVRDLLEDLVNNSASPLRDATDVFEDYLDKSTDLDATQKAGALSGFLKDAYTQINQQAMSTALDLMKTNETLKLEKYKTEAAYNSEMARIAVLEEDTALKASEILLKNKEALLIDMKLLTEEGVNMERLAKLNKQFGYPNAVLQGATVLVNDSNGVVPGGTGYVTTYGIDVTSSLGVSSGKGAVDKQIVGYDKLNLKDVLKTMDEKAALMQNAKVPETLHEKAARIELIAEISKHDSGTLTYKLVDGSNTYIYSPNINDAVPFNGTWSPALP